MPADAERHAGHVPSEDRYCFGGPPGQFALPLSKSTARSNIRMTHAGIAGNAEKAPWSHIPAFSAFSAGKLRPK
jgi:hypothetical protein